MTTTERIKQELFNADLDYQDILKRFKTEYPHGVNFCYDTVKSKAASMCMSLSAAEAKVAALSYLVTPKGDPKETEAEATRLIKRYTEAETEEEATAAEQAYYKLYSVRTD